MPRLAKPTADSNFDVVVIGAHPCASLAALLLARQAGIRVLRLRASDSPGDDRLALLNPELFQLDAALKDLAKRVDAAPIHGLRFLSNEPPLASEYHSKSTCGWIASTKAVRTAVEGLAADGGARIEQNRSLEISQVDENGVEISFESGGSAATRKVRARMLIVAEDLPHAQSSKLNLDEHGGEPQVLHRYSILKCKGHRGIETGAGGGGGGGGKTIIPMALDLAGQLIWAWMLIGKSGVQFCVEQSPEQAKRVPPHTAMQTWLDLLAKHGAVAKKNLPDLSSMQTLDLPLAGALQREGVADRTLLIGPAGGFFTACAEEVYPACWSAMFAVDVARRALKERHLQDSLQNFRHTWGSTLGDYLRGPQQNLRFLLPLIYRNKVMASRIGEAILTGKSVVR